MLADKLRAATAAAASVEPVGIDFDGTNDYLSRSSDLVGNADGKTFTFSAWVYPAETGDIYCYYSDASGTQRVGIITNNTGGVSITCRNSSGTNILVASTTEVVPLNTFTHILVSVDLASTGNRAVYINDQAASVTWTTYTNDSINFSVSRHAIGAVSTSGFGRKCRLAGVYLDYTYRDLSVESNRRDFIDADGRYVKPPTSGIISVPMDDPEDPGRNDGTGGDFTLNGVVAQAGRGPNQYNAPASTFVADTDWLQQSGNAGAASGKVFTFSCVAKPNPTNNAYVFTFFNSTTPVFAVRLRWDGGAYYVLEVTGNNGSGLTFFTADTDLFPLYAYTHFAFSVDMTSQAALQVFINGEEITNITVNAFVDANINFATATTVNVANQYTAAGGFEGELSDLWFDTTYIDLSADNPFYDTETGKPKYLGASGELPTGSAPLIYLPLRADDAGSNKGTGGDFTVNSGPYTGARGPSEFWGESAEFNGSNQILNRFNSGSNALIGATDGKQFSIAVAFKHATGSIDANESFLGLTNADSSSSGMRLQIGYDSSFKRIEVRGENSSGTQVLWATSATTNTLDNTDWHVLLFSVDMSSSGKRHLYLDGVSDYQNLTYTDDNIEFSSDRCVVGAVSNFFGFMDGKIGFLWFNTEYIDFSQEANRLKFFDAFGYPVDLGEDGSLPTGNQPLIYMNNDFQLGTNLGSGGNFTPQNTPTDGGYVKG